PGLSNGGAMTMTMTMTMICARAELFTAAASVIFNLTDDMAQACRPVKQVPMLMITGTAAPLIPCEVAGGSSRFARPGFWSTMKTFDFWRHVNGCDAQQTEMAEL